MKTKKVVLSLCAIAICALLFFSFRTVPSRTKYQYLTVYSFDESLFKIIISIDGKELKKLNFNSQTKGNWDMNPLINLIHQYENEGWELMDLRIGMNPNFYMRKEIE